MLLGYRKVFMMKLLTITVPSYNSEAYLDRCMATLLPGGDEVEILIVDDGSTDRTAEIADEYERKYPNIVRAIHKENGGHGDAVTTGIRNATGLFFKVVDSDDSLAPEAYKQVLDFLRRIVKKNHLVELLDGFHQHGGIHAQLLSQLLKGIGAVNLARRHQIVDVQAVGVVAVLVQVVVLGGGDDVEDAAGLLQGGGSQHVAALGLVYIALAFLVDDIAVAARALAFVSTSGIALG